MAGKLTIRWRGDVQLSAIHAAYVVASDSACSDRKTHQVLVQSATAINHRLLSASIDVPTFWERLFAEYAFDPNNQRACEIALIEAGGSELQLDQVAKAISSHLGECRIAFQSRYPKLAEQLELRIRPLQERWDSVGPGLLIQIAKQIWGDDPPSDWWPTRVEAIAIQPLRGGDGNFNAESRKFWIEAVLTDIEPAVPEVLRVAWLLTQLAVDIEMREKSSEHGTHMPWMLACVPIVLAAGAELNLTSEPLPISTAFRLWRLGDDSTAKLVQQWWDQWRESETPLPVAMKALDRHLHPSAEREGSGVFGDSADET